MMSKCVPATQNMFNVAHLEYHYYCGAMFKYVDFVAIVHTDKDIHTPHVFPQVMGQNMFTMASHDFSDASNAGLI